MCPNKYWFEMNRLVVVQFSWEIPYRNVGIGMIQVRMHDGAVRKLFGVRHVLDLRRNLVSLGTLESDG